MNVTSRRAFRGAFYAGGAIATAAGLHSMLLGGRAIPGLSRDLGPVAESELRFFSGFYAAYGVLMLSLASRVDDDPRVAGSLAGALFLAGLGRIAGWASVGRPNRAQRGLLAIELLAPPAVIAWQRRLG